MPLSTRYNVMINDALNAIPIQQPEDFALIIKELRKILSDQPDLFSLTFKKPIETLYEFLSDADLYVQASELKEYRALIRTMIQQKIDAFSHLTQKQKDEIIADKQSMKVIAAASHAKINAHDTPEKRLVSEEVLKRGAIEENQSFYYEDILASEEHHRITLHRKIEKERKQQRTVFVVKSTLFFIFLVTILAVNQQVEFASTLDECKARLPKLPPSMHSVLSVGALSLLANLFCTLTVSIKPYVFALTQHHFFSSDPQQSSPSVEAYGRFVNEVMHNRYNVELESHAVPRTTTV